MRRRTLPLPLLSLWPLLNGPSPQDGPKPEDGHGPLAFPPLAPTNRTISLFAVLAGALTWGASAGALHELARKRSGWEPGLLRVAGGARHYGLFQFQQTQWREVMLGRGASVVDVLRTDIMDPDLQADAAAYLLLNNRPIRGEGVHG